MHIYDRDYYTYINAGSIRSARVLLPMVARLFDIRSVADFGAGQGAWLSVWQDLGVTDIAALDGSYIDTGSLLIPRDKFVPVDLSQRVRLARPVDLVQSLEVAEHLPSSAAAQFIDNLVAHSPVVLFSAACPGQGGEFHINERPYSYWRGLFRERDYVMLDAVRPLLKNSFAVQAWYRYNTFLYVRRDRLVTLPAAIQSLQIGAADRIQDVSPMTYRARKMVIRMLPVRAVNGLAVLRKKYHVAFSTDALSA